VKATIDVQRKCIVLNLRMISNESFILGKLGAIKYGLRRATKPNIACLTRQSTGIKNLWRFCAVALRLHFSTKSPQVFHPVIAALCCPTLKIETMKSLKRKGKNWLIPIQGNSVIGVCIGGSFRLDFEDSRFIEINSEFRYRLYQNEDMITVFNLDEARKLVELFQSTVIEAIAFHTGELFLSFDNGIELYVEDGPYENWHFYGDLTSTIHGGIGRLVEC